MCSPCRRSRDARVAFRLHRNQVPPRNQKSETRNFFPICEIYVICGSPPGSRTISLSTVSCGPTNPGPRGPPGLGTIYEADVSIAHGYHGISLLRQFLQVGLRLPRVSARTFASRVVNGPDRKGISREKSIVESERTIAQLDYGDRLGIYDFTEDQYFSWIRSPRLLVRGEEGEINQTTVRLLHNVDSPFQFDLVRRDTGQGGNLEGYAHQMISGGGEILYRNPFPTMRWSDDEIAVATSLSKMTNYLTSSEPFYSVAEACQDCYLDWLIKEAVDSGREAVGEPQPWM
jgi:hypothetical protein